ncbi:3-dehydroquinate synthase [Candidatus Peregrinibacteria bacterium CG_4_10_14_0_2_um_filter_38_24]|nr:MAG: 3-dehydroquinate synthase [Candidatus Peregrinibacteria bacterium CG_4_10_14_0_2_um_filter_38_24]PJC38696.1 MAG: 3-dehydroquinate synthase [Candidatus Peregrinibacteria bacterium CG_4_9_14_0_2_um_filter_38_9]
MPKIKVKIARRPRDKYTIFIKENCIDYLPEFLKENKIGTKYAILTDSKTKKIYGDSLLRFLKKNKINAELISFDQGEKSKTLATVEKLAEEMITKNFDRDSAIIVLGGGVAGDIGGFLASIFMRGIPHIQIPTTLLAMVDSAIGGKTGVDLEGGKNLIGTTSQPKAIFVDINYLKTLPQNQIVNGLSEIIKYGIIKDKKLFKYIEKNLEKILGKETEALEYIIERSIKIKVKIIERDEKELTNERILLNYGHTFGHALEKMSNYTLLHGFAISIGMVIINKLAVEQKIMKEKEAKRIKALLKKAGLPITSMKKPETKDILSDKKRSGNFMNFVFAKKIGKAIVRKEKITKL